MKRKFSFTDLRHIYAVAEDLDVDFRELAEEMINKSEDFQIGDYRFIMEDEIDDIQIEELKSDPYILGCFNDWFISDNSDLSPEIVKALQEGEKYEELGQHLIDNDFVEDMQEEYARLDGYGHHFSNYDGNTIEDLLTEGYYIFKVS